MNNPGVISIEAWPLAVYFVAVLFLVFLMIGFSSVLGQRHRERSTAEPYESGMVATGSARLRFDVKFYLVAMVFVIFDLEAALIYSWSIVVREAGWLGYVEILIFIGILMAALFYVWKQGIFEWGKSFLRK